MLIRSQNKKNLTNLSQVTNIAIIARDSRFKIVACYPVEDGYDYMGEYSTETKAIKVLDMIQDAYISNSIDGDFPVFHMPTDEEVEG